MIKLQVVQVTRAYYDNTLSLLSPSRRRYLDENVVADKYYLVFRGLPVAGFATNGNGYLTGLFSLVPSIGEELITLRLKQALGDLAFSHSLTLFCIGDKIKNMYIARGFTVVETQQWSSTLAPKNWDSAETPNMYHLKMAVK